MKNSQKQLTKSDLLTIKNTIRAGEYAVGAGQNF